MLLSKAPKNQEIPTQGHQAPLQGTTPTTPSDALQLVWTRKPESQPKSMLADAFFQNISARSYFRQRKFPEEVLAVGKQRDTASSSELLVAEANTLFPSQITPAPSPRVQDTRTRLCC